MDDELRSLKDSLDETYFKELELSKSLKRRILKNATASSRSSRMGSNIKYALTILAAASCMIALILSMLPSKTNQARKPSLQEQQVALLHFQTELEKLVKKQQPLEQALLVEAQTGKQHDKMEMYRNESIKEGEKIIEGLKKTPVPSELSAYSDEINESLLELAKAYEQKNQFYRELKVETFQGIDPNHPSVDHFILFTELIGKVYVEVKLQTPNFYILLTFLV